MSVEKRQKEQEKTSMVVEGFLFANEAEAAQARKEAEGVKYVKEKAQMDDPEMVLRIYNKMIQQRLFDTAVGYSYLKDLQEYLQSIPFIRKEDIFPIPVQHPQVEESLRKAKRAPAPKPKTCDEATSALDPNTTHAILTLIKDINKKLGITVVVITHQMSVVEEICDHVAILDGGVVVEEGSVQEIFSNPKTPAAKRLVAPNGGSAARDLSSFAPDDHVVRVTFNGSSTAKPLVASLAAEKGILVSVLSADTRDLSGQCYGSMLLKLPADVEQAKQAAAYMRAQPGITVEEVTGE